MGGAGWLILATIDMGTDNDSSPGFYEFFSPFVSLYLISLIVFFLSFVTLLKVLMSFLSFRLALYKG